ncbi:aldo/keto reductase [Sulfurivermis fontis]|uniref:aldo/keto reductase n=1 Tax=Sulfurivermis fontis TaxID=1972068 RepID=UPI000FD9991A|nr:aldo/keto reductase [Sulfurivermis fontis]
MELRVLGSTGMQVSPLGLGTVKIGRDQQVKYPTGFTIPDDAAVRALFDLAWELGINTLDTAPAYGNSEERLGQLLPHKDDWIIVGKVGEIFENGQSSFDFSAAFTRRSVERSLKRLRRDYLDIVLVHSDGDDMRIIREEAVCDTLQQLKQEGLIRAIGMSTKTVAGGLWCVENMDVVMATYNLAYTDELPVLQRAAQLHKGVLIKKGLQSGHAQSVEEALRYVFAQPAVHSVIVGTINPGHLRANVAITERILAGR